MRKIFKKEKMLAFLLSTTMLFNMSGIAMAAETDAGKVKAAQAQTQEQNKVIEISSEEQLRKMADNLSGDYVLTKSITLKKKWQPIGDKKNPFTGTLDGKGHVIRDMDICLSDSKESGYAGLFGVMDSACVKNLALEDINITSAARNGAYIGGIAGKMDNSTVSDVYVSGNITGQNVQNETIGGIAGAIFQNKVTSEENISLERAISRININFAQKGDTGLLAGWVSGLEYIQHCYTDSKKLSMFGTGVKWGQNRVLLKQAFLSENNFYGFDFKDTWEMTKQGPKLCRQVEDDTLEFYKEKFSYATEETTKKKVIQEKEKQGTTDKQNTEINQKKETTQKSDTNILDTIKKQISNYSTALTRATSDITSGDFTYQLSGNDAQITSYKGSGGNVTIPETIDGHTVTTIKYNAFKNNANITGITLPKTIKEVGYSAFENCTGLKSFRMNYNGTVEYKAEIGNAAFRGCTSLTDVSLSENVTSIGSMAFSGCTSLETLNLPERVESLGRCLIEKTAISSITIPKNVKYSTNVSSSYGVLVNVNTLKTVTFEEGMEAIPSCIMASGSYTSYIDKIILPSQLKKIGSSAFYNCGKITQMEVPKTITEIGGSAFENCTGLKSFRMNYNGTVEYKAEIGNAAFRGCTSLTDVSLSENVTSIGSMAFSGCTSLETLNLPERVESLGRCLIGKTAISSITIPKNVKYSADANSSSGVLANVKALKTVTFEQGMKAIPSYIMASGGYTSYIEKVIIPDTVTSIGSHAFYKCDNITIYGYKNSYAETYANENDIPFVSVAIAKNATAQDVLSKIDLKKLLSKTSLGSTTINGPEVTVAGKTFPVFSFNAGGDLNLGEHLQAKVDMKTKTVQILIGLDDFKGSADLDADINSNNYWKESYAQVKSLYKGVRGANASTDKLYHGFQKLRGKLRKTQCKIGVNAEAEAVGYVEFSFASGEMMSKSGGLVMKASIGYEETQHFPPCPALYVVFGLNAQFGSELKLERIKEMQYAPSIDANINLAATVGVGAGVKKASTYAEVGVTGNLDIGIHLPESSLEKALNVGADVEVYFNSKAFGFDGPSYGPKKLGSVQIYPRNRRSRMKLHSAAIDSYDWSDATPMQRNYLKKSNTRLRSRAVTKIQKDSQFNKSNVYPYNAAQIVSLKNGKEFLFWIDDDGTKENVNKTSLMYSIKDEDSWSEPQKLAETGGANDYPYVYSDGNRIAVVWQKADKMGTDATLPQILKTVELYEIVYENGQFGTAKRITSANTTYEMMQKVAMNGNETAVVWVENSTNDPFQSSGKNTVKLSVKKGGSWTQKTIASNVDTVKNIALAYVSGEPVIIYETGDESTTTIHYEKGSTKKTYTGQGVQIENGVMYYSDGQTIKSYDILTGYEESTGLPAMNDFTVVDNGRTKAVYTTIADGYKSELAVYSFDTSVGKWNEQAMVTDDQKYIRNYSVALDAQNNPIIALNAVTVNENADDIYGDSTLMVLKQNQNVDIALTENISYEESLVKPNGKLPIYFEVKNKGTQPVTSFTAKLSDSSGNVLTSQKIACYIDAGSTEMAQVIYNLPANITRHKVNLEIEAEGEDKLSDNSKEISVGYADLSLESVYLSGKRTEAYLEGTVENAGYDTAKNVKVNFYFEEEETPFKTVNAQTLSAGSQNSFKVAIPEKYMEIAPLAGGNNIHIEVASDTDELQYENNEKDFLILSPEEQRIALNAVSLQLKEQESTTLKVTYCDEGISEEDIIWGTSDDKVVTVDKNGKVTALQAGKATITANMNGVKAECEVTVWNLQEETVQEVLLNVNSMRIKSGERQVLNASILPESVKNSQFTWKSADESIATVSSLGRVTGISAGETTITVTTADGYHFAECHVTVYQEVKQIYKVFFEGGQGATGQNPSVITGITGDTITLPENPYSKSGMVFEGWNDGSTTYKEGVSYKIGYSDVVFTAQWRNEEKAEYTITASAGQNGTITPSGNVKVKEGESQSFSITPAQGYIIEKVLVDGENIGAKTSYIFENVTKEHTISAIFKKKVNNIDVPIVPDIPRINKVKKIYLNGLSTKIAAGKKLKLTAIILPANATNKKLLWKSSNQKAATVTKSGVVTLPKKGAGKKATITAMALDGSGVYAIWKVTSMSGIVKSIKLTGAKKVKAGKKVKVKAQIKATKKANKKLNWTSSNIKYATVTKNGAVKTKKAGKGKKVKITAAATDGSGKKAAITIKMK